MNAADAFLTHRSLFDEELDKLINQTAGASIALATPPAADPKKRPASALEHTSKKQRRDSALAVKMLELHLPSPDSPSRATFVSPTRGGGSDNHALHMHPSRRALLDGHDSPSSHVGSLGNRHAHGSNDERRQGPSLIDKSRGTLLAPNSSPVRPAFGNADPTPRLDVSEQTWTTVRNAVQRQRDPRKDDMAYEALLELRRNEKIEDIDRYVPSLEQANRPRHMQPAPHRNQSFPIANLPKAVLRRNQSFPFEKLPELVRNRILELVLVSSKPIVIDLTWLRKFLEGHARVPKSSMIMDPRVLVWDDPGTWSLKRREIATMHEDMIPFKAALEQRAEKSRKTKGPCRGLTTSLLRVFSHKVSSQAARIFYGQNTFRFPSHTTSWMQLESFLITIGPTNVANLRSLQVHIPLWHFGVLHDHIDGEVLNLTSPVSRLAILRPSPHDRLLSAIENCSVALLRAKQLLSLELLIGRSPDGLPLAYWTGKLQETRVELASDVREHRERKQKGIELLKRLSSVTSRSVLGFTNGARLSEYESETAEKLELLTKEAQKYGWQLDAKVLAL